MNSLSIATAAAAATSLDREWRYRDDADFLPGQGRRPALRYNALYALASYLDYYKQMGAGSASGWKERALEYLGTNDFLETIARGDEELRFLMKENVLSASSAGEAAEIMRASAPRLRPPSLAERVEPYVLPTAVAIGVGLVLLTTALAAWSAVFKSRTGELARPAWLEYREAHCEPVGIDVDRMGRKVEGWKCSDPKILAMDDGRGIPNEARHLFEEAESRAKCAVRAEMLPWRTRCSETDGGVER